MWPAAAVGCKYIEYEYIVSLTDGGERPWVVLGGYGIFNIGLGRIYRGECEQCLHCEEVTSSMMNVSAA